MTFVHQALTWGFLLALLPVLIHLINLVRRRRVQWAAMDFLLQSYRRHRTWIWLKQLLLLLLRVAAVALLVAMLAQWVTRQEWFALFGGQATHHYVVLDDSYSMSDRLGGTSAFDRALKAMASIGGQTMARDTRQKFTLLRFSRAASGSGVDVSDAPERVLDLGGKIVDSNFDVTLEDKRRDMTTSELAVGPLAALQLLDQLIDAGGDENNMVYLLSDFREKDWENPAEIRRLLGGISRTGADIHFVRCAPSQQSNLALVDVAPAGDTRAAGVPLFVNVSITNFGREAARKVPLQIRTLYYDPQAAAASEPGALAAELGEPPAVLIDEIGPQQTVTTRVQVYFPQPGKHVVEARLPDDAVADDNLRRCVIELPAAEPVLVIDGSPTQRHAYYLQIVFQPGQRANTGIQPVVETPAFLRNATLEDLQRFRVIYLMDVDFTYLVQRRAETATPPADAGDGETAAAREDDDPASNRQFDRLVQLLEDYLRGGGGIAFFVGDQVNTAIYNERLYRDGAGLFPLPLSFSDDLEAELFENAPDFEVADHPLFDVFLGERNSLLRRVTIQRYFQAAEAWSPPPDSTVQVIARLRNGRPFVVERRLGDGRVVAFLSTCAPDWNNWAYDPSYVVAMLQLQSYLAAPSRTVDRRLVGAPLTVNFSRETHRLEVSFVVPGDAPDNPLVIESKAAATADQELLVAALGGPRATAAADGPTERSGIYEAWLETLPGPFDVRRFALNVDPGEGNLAIADSQTLLTRLDPIKIEIRSADQYAFGLGDQAGVNRSLLLMALLVTVLLGEQLLAYFASYHPAKGAVR